MTRRLRIGRLLAELTNRHMPLIVEALHSFGLLSDLGQGSPPLTPELDIPIDFESPRFPSLPPRLPTESRVPFGVIPSNSSDPFLRWANSKISSLSIEPLDFAPDVPPPVIPPPRPPPTVPPPVIPRPPPAVPPPVIPPPRPPPTVPPPVIPRPPPTVPPDVSDRQIIDSQDLEFAGAESEAAFASQQLLAEREIADELRRITESELSDRRLLIHLASQDIPPEPDEGIEILVSFPPHGQAQRKFNPDDLGIYVYTWVCDQDFMWQDGALLEFELKLGPIEFHPDVSLVQQGITGKCKLAVIEIDND